MILNNWSDTMSYLTRWILVFIIGIISTFLYILILMLTPNTERKRAIVSASNLGKLPSISLSTTFVESRILEYDDYTNNFYPGMQKDSFSGFVYAK